MTHSKPNLGSDERFKAVERSAAAHGAKKGLYRRPSRINPAAVAAATGSKKYGKEKMSEMAEKGRERHREKD